MRGSAALRAAVAPGGALAGPWVRNDLWRRARAVPSLDLRFADNKSLVDATTGAQLVTFTRASSATYVDSEGVIRPAVTNFALRSEDLGGAGWGVTGSGATITATTDIAAPNGTMTAWTLTSSADFAQIQQTPTGQASGVTYTGSFWIRRRSGTGTVNIRVSENVNTPLSGVTSDWQRFSFTATSTTTTVRIGINLSSPANAVDLWGAQLEQSSSVGEYVPTTSTINSAPRFDHNPVTGESLGLLVEEQRTNLLLRSEELDNASWTQAFLNEQVTANSVSAPNGSSVADTVATANTTAEFGVGQNATVTANSPVTISIFAKAAASNFVYLRHYGGATNLFYTIIVDLSSGTVTKTATGSSTSAVSHSVQVFPNGWYRITISSTSNTTNSFLIAGPALTSTASIGASFGEVPSIGTGNESIYLYGAQMEQGAFPTSYIPTTTAAATRSADVASISGSNFSSWYRQDEGTLFAEVDISNVAAGRILQVSDGTGANRQDLAFASGTLLAFVNASNSAQVNALTSNSVTANANARVAYAYQQDNFAWLLNAGAAQTDTSGSLPTVDRLGIGQRLDTTGSLNGHVKRLALWPSRLPNSTLQAITG